MVAALFVRKDGPYFGRADVDPWDETRDARLYDGPDPVVCHSPCPRYGRFATKGGRKVGDDQGCFLHALASVFGFGGVLEHPANSKAWDIYNLPKPVRIWTCHSQPMRPLLWVCEVDQGVYGFPARKRTWLLYVGKKPPEPLDWTVSGIGRRVASGRCGVEILSKRQRELTPPLFAEALIRLAEGAR